jgi:hypothetical protein
MAESQTNWPDRSQSGEELVERFFAELSQLDGIDAEVVEVLQQLYASKRLTREAILQGLVEVRGKQNA